jgi:AcrR family transcriptional regulator
MRASVPRLSPANQAHRRQHILQAARACFSRRGLHATSMQDILREADVSAGALYCYFRGKHDIVAAIIDEVLAELTARVDELANRGNGLSNHQLVESLVDVFEHRDWADDLARLAIQLWAESLFDMGLATRFADRYHRLEEVLDQLLLTSAPAKARLLVGLGQAYLLQRAIFGKLEADQFRTAAAELLGEPVQQRGATRR